MGGYTYKPPAPSPISPPLTSSPGGYPQRHSGPHPPGGPHPPHKPSFSPQALNQPPHNNPHSSHPQYPKQPAPPRMGMEPRGGPPTPQRGPTTGGRGVNNHPPPHHHQPPARGDSRGLRDSREPPQPTPANHTGVPYSHNPHFQPHPGLGHTAPHPPASSTAVPQQHNPTPPHHEAWRPQGQGQGRPQNNHPLVSPRFPAERMLPPTATNSSPFVNVGLSCDRRLFHTHYFLHSESTPGQLTTPLRS